jgi:hypothetical protein
MNMNSRNLSSIVTDIRIVYEECLNAIAIKYFYRRVLTEYCGFRFCNWA